MPDRLERIQAAEKRGEISPTASYLLRRLKAAEAVLLGLHPRGRVKREALAAWLESKEEPDAH